MDMQYVVADGLWTTDDQFKRAVEVRVGAEQEDGIAEIPASELTSLQMFGWNSGAPLSGQVVFGPKQLRELHEAIGKRLAELDEMAVQQA